MLRTGMMKLIQVNRLFSLKKLCMVLLAGAYAGGMGPVFFKASVASDIYLVYAYGSLPFLTVIGYILFRMAIDQWAGGRDDPATSTKGQIKALMNSTPDMVWICDRKCCYTAVNKVFCEEIDLPEAMIYGKTAHEVWDQASADKFSRNDDLVLADRNVKYEQTFCDANDNRGWLQISKAPIYGRNREITGYVGIARDVTREKYVETERKELETQLRQSQKMEAIGTLAGGIAHDFNNILAAIMGYTEISLAESKPDSPLIPRLERILKASHRGKDLVNQILTFSRQNEKKKHNVKLDYIVDEALALLRPLIPSSIRISNYKSSNPCAIYADPTQIHQVLMNLCTNSAYAMRREGGTLDIRVEHYTLSHENSAVYGGLPSGKYARLTVSDTGPGIDAGIRNRIFEPFYTTKKKGEGTGMGLAVVHGIIKDLGGTIVLATEPEKGATFQILIPEVDEAEQAESQAMPLISIGNERILFVDDEEIIVEMAQEMLERLGYDVTSLKNSEEALALFRRHHDRFNLVVTDLTMPNMTGEELAKEMLRIRSDIPIILCTGFSEVVPPEKAKEIGIKEYIMKPFLNRELAVTIRKVLDSPVH